MIWQAKLFYYSLAVLFYVLLAGFVATLIKAGW